MLHAFTQLFTVMVPTFALGIGAWIAKSLHTTAQHNAAALLSRIAQEAAALVVLNNPSSSAAMLLQATVSQISGASGLPTSNPEAITRAAAAALAAVKPAGARPA
jgi:hypothetical protein